MGSPKPATKLAAVLWTGGKDSVLALHEAALAGYEVRYLVTFAPPGPDFLAHPIRLMKLQAEALGLQHFVWPVTEPYAESYEAGLTWLKEAIGVDTVITGDIAEVAGNPNWIRERSRKTGMSVLTPLWGRDRRELLETMLAKDFRVTFSCVKTRWLATSWLGREMTRPAIAELQEIRRRNGMDLCGEEGEYHTLVTDAPNFKQRLKLNANRVRELPELAYLEIDHAGLQIK